MLAYNPASGLVGSPFVRSLRVAVLFLAALIAVSCGNTSTWGGSRATEASNSPRGALARDVAFQPQPGPAVHPSTGTHSDEVNEFVQTEERAVRSSRTVFDGGAAWFTTSWTYSPDDLAARLHHAKVYFGCVRVQGGQPRYFYLARCSTRVEVADPLLNVGIGFRTRREAGAVLVDLRTVKGGVESTYASELEADEVSIAGTRGLCVTAQHESGESYCLMYPAEFFRGFMAGIGSGQGSGVSENQTLARRLVGREILAIPSIAAGLPVQARPAVSIGQELRSEAVRVPEQRGTVLPFRSGIAENGSYYGELNSEGRPKTVNVSGYFRRDGTYVRGHYRSKPRR